MSSCSDAETSRPGREHPSGCGPGWTEDRCETSHPAASGPEAVEFIRFCRGRRRVGWPELYDEMVLVAGRGLFHGYGFDELSRCGVVFSLAELPRLAGLVARVVAEERPPTAIGVARRGRAVLGGNVIGPMQPRSGADGPGAVPAVGGAAPLSNGIAPVVAATVTVASSVAAAPDNRACLPERLAASATS